MAFTYPSQNQLGKRPRQDSIGAESFRSNGLFVTPAPQSQSQPRYEPTPSWMGHSPAPTNITSERDGEDEAEEDDDEEEEEQTGYDEETEPFPAHAAFDPRLQELQAQVLATIQKLEAVLRSHGNDSKDLQNMLLRAAEAAGAPNEAKKIVGLLGDTGTGKSSSVNSLAGILGLAIAVAAGESCTKVITLFVQSLHHQVSEFAAEIRYSDLETYTALLLEQLNNYNRFTFEYSDDWLDDQKTEYRRQSETAFKIFRSLFCDKMEFESPGAAKQFLQQKYRDAINPTIDIFVSWCRDLFSEYGVIDGVAVQHFEAETVAELNEQLSPHVSEDDDFTKPTLCHLIELVRVGAPSSRILRYISLADLPGTSDTDTIRANIAHKFLQKCDALLVFEPMSRCLHHPSLERNVATNGERFGRNLSVCITRSDDNCDNMLAEKMAKERQSVGRYFELGELIAELDVHINGVNKKLRDAKGKGKAKRQKTIDNAEREHLAQQKVDLIESRQGLKNEQFEFLVEARNTNTTRRLQQDKQRHMPQGVELTVHCISNTHCAALMRGSEPDGPQLSMEATGIPALRAWLLAMAAPSLLRAAESHIGRASVFVRGVSLWAENTPQKRRAGIMEIVRDPLQSWVRCVDTYLDAAQSSVRDGLMRPLQNGRGSTLNAALVYFKQLQTWNASTLRSFFSRNGRHATGLHHANWNERLMDDQTKNIIRPEWPSMATHLRALLKEAVDKLVTELRAIPARLNGNENAIAQQTNSFQVIINDHCLNIWRAYDARLEEFQKELGNIKQNAEFDGPTGYFTNAMAPMYQSCRSMTGAGCTKRMMTELSDHLHGLYDPSPFAITSERLKHDLNESTNRVGRNLQSDIRRILAQIEQQLDAILARQQEVPEEALARRSLNQVLVHCLPDVERVKVDLENIKQSYPGSGAAAWASGLAGGRHTVQDFGGAGRGGDGRMPGSFSF